MSYVEFLQQQGKINNAIFSFHLSFSYHRYQPDDESYVTFGGYNKSAIVGDIHWFHLSSTYHWTIRAYSISYDGQEIRNSYVQETAIVDTGTSLLLVP